MIRPIPAATGGAGALRNAVWSAAVAAGVALALVVLPAAGRPGTAQAVPAPKAAPEDWIQLFNGHDLRDWTIKFATQDPGINLHDEVANDTIELIRILDVDRVAAVRHHR